MLKLPSLHIYATIHHGKSNSDGGIHIHIGKGESFVILTPGICFYTYLHL